MNYLEVPEIEKAILGHCMMGAHETTLVTNKVSHEDFHDEHHKLIFQAIEELYQNDKEPSVISIEHTLSEWGKLDRIGTQFLLDLNSYNSGNIEWEIDILRDRSTRRALRAGINNLHQQIPNTQVSTGELISELERLQTGAIQHTSIPGLTPLQIYERDQNKPKFERLTIGDPFFDNKMYSKVGSHKGTTEVVFGLTKHGKTRYAKWRTAQYLKQGYKGIYYTAEDRDSSIQDSMWRLLEDKELGENLIIADKSQGVDDLTSLMNLIRYWNAKIDIDFVVVDYLQRIPVHEIPFYEEGQRIITCSNNLTDLANQQAFFGLMLAQPHRLEKHRKGWFMEPNIHDLYGSSALEKDAFVATSVFRPNQVESLQVTDEYGELTAVQDASEQNTHRNSVFIRQQIVREGELLTSRYQFIDSDRGLLKNSEFRKLEENQNETQPF